MHFKRQRANSDEGINLTPLIDVVFLLIIFFMLVNNIIGAGIMPRAAGARPGGDCRETPSRSASPATVKP